MYKLNLFLLLTLFSFLVISCKEEKDDILPTIEILKPTHNQYFNVMDTMMVVATITDETHLENITVTLTDMDYKSVGKSYSVPVKANPQQIGIEYELDNRLLPSGKYYLSVEASDGYNIKHKYQEITINGIEKELLNVLIASENQNNWDLISIDKSGNQSTKSTFSFLYDHFNFFSAYDQLIVYNPDLKDLIASEYINSNPVWNISLDKIQGEPALTYSDIIDNTLFICTFNGKILQYNSNGFLKKSNQLNDGYYLKYINKIGDLYVSIEKSRSNGKARLNVYYATTFALKQSVFLDFDANMWKQHTANEIILTGVKSFSGCVKTYNLSTNSITTFVQTPISAVKRIESFQNGFYYVADSSSIYLYQYNPLSFYKVIENIYPIDFRVESVSGKIFVLTQNKLLIYSFLSAQPENVYNIPGNCKAFTFRYTI